MPSLNVLLAAEESAGLRTLRALERAGHRPVAVLTSVSDDPQRGATVAGFAQRAGIEVLPAELVREASFARRVRALGIDLLLNVHSLHVAHGDVVGAPRIGSFNMHPGPLPAYAGLDVVSWAIYHGETAHGVTLHWMDAGVDTGAIAYEAAFDIEEDDSALSVYGKCTRYGLPLVEELVAAAARDPASIPAVPQDASQRRYFRRQVPHGGWIPWSRPAAEIVNLVRACDYHPFPSPWGLARTALGEEEIAILRAARTGERCDAPPGTVGETGIGLVVAAADEWVRVEQVRVGGQAVLAVEILQPGQRLVA